MFTKKILAAAITSQPSASSVVDAIDFDGATDYLSRSSDLVGNADGKTFTFSAWVWLNGQGNEGIYHSGIGEVGLYIYAAGSSGQIVVQAFNAATTQILSTGSAVNAPFKTWFNLLISLDMSNTSNRSIYINDISVASSWSVYTNDTIDFTQTSHFVGARNSLITDPCQGRLAHVFLDYTYRDLSIEANRRIFVLP